MRRGRAFLLWSVLLLALASPAHAQQATADNRRIAVSEDGDYYGNDYSTLFDVDLDTCKSRCLDDGKCRAFTYNEAARRCFLKTDFGKLLSAPGAIAGRVVEAKAETAQRPPALTFLPGGMADDATRERQEIERLRAPQSAGFEALRAAGERAAAAGEPRKAVSAYRSALSVNPDAADVWMALARQTLAINPKDYSERYDLPRAAISAALNAYRTAGGPDERAQTLAGLAEALARAELYRPALEAYKASLALANAPAVRAAFEALRDEHGFRVVDYTVDSDSASPRICVEFSEPLARLPDGYAQYVTVNERSPEAVEAQDRQICIEGVEHGKRYRVTLRPGIPSTVEEVIESPVALSVYVRDRAPSVRFTGNNFVLPPLGQQTIPLVSVNASDVALKLYRVGDRGLADAVNDDTFLSQLNSYRVDEIAGERGETLWSGSLDVTPELNREVTTGIPVERILKERTPGVYVLTARAQEASDRPWDAQATQWFVVSDIGLSAYSGTDGLHVFARSLSDADPLDGIALELVARNNDVLATATTDGRGYAHFAAGLARGEGGNAPALVTASRADGSDFGFMDLTGAAFDLSDRGVSGRAAPGALDVFLYTERGIYRPGGTVHMAALMRDDTQRAVADTPLTFVVDRPDGVEHARILSADGGAGGHAHDLALPPNAMRGTWHVRAYADPNGPALSEQPFLVEDFVPERMELALDARSAMLVPGEPTAIEASGRYLYGAPAAGLRLEGELVVKPVSTLKDYPGYSFGLAEEETVPERSPLGDLPATNEDGKAVIDIVAGALPTTTHPLEAEALIRLREASGRAVERSVTIPVEPSTPLIGLKPLFSGDGVDEGATAAFDVVAVAPDLRRTAASGLTWQLVKLERNFQWYQAGGGWRFEPVTFTRRVADGRVDVAAGEPARISASVDWGRYRLEISGDGPSAPATSVEFTAGRYVATASADTPDTLEVSLDKESYRAGETARLAISPRFAGIAMVTVMGETLISMTPVEVPAEGTVVELPVTEDWGAGAYVTATLYRPADAEEKRMPARAMGLAWLGRDMSDRTLDVALDLPDRVRPDRTLKVPVAVSGARAGEPVYLTLAAVDVGILNLTRYEAPDPVGWYYGQRRLGMEIRDIYGQLIDGMRGAPGTVRSGGGAGGLSMEGSPPTQELVATFSGIVETDRDGKATVSVPLPQFNGSVRFMAVAWSDDAVGGASRDVTVRDPVVVTASLPRFMAPGDRARLTLEIDNREAPAGEYELAIETTEGLTVSPSDARRTVTLQEDGRQTLAATLAAGETGGQEVTVSLAGQGLDLGQTLRLPVRPASGPVSEREVIPLPADGGTLTLGEDILGDRIGPGATVAVSVMQSGALDVPALLYALDRYPYGCAEQLTSRALPLLYLDQVAATVGLAGEDQVRERIATAITRVLSYQGSNGSFGLWGPGSDDLWLNAYVSDFLTRAREQGYEVPALAFTQALDRLQNALAYAPDVASGGGEDVAYALYVLARNRRAAIGDLRYYADAKLADFGSSLAQAQIGAALAFYGERERARRAFETAVAGLRAEPASSTSRADYGSRLRDAAAVLALMSEAAPAVQPSAALAELVSAERAGARHTSTQEDAWLLLAAHGLMTGSKGLALEVGGKPMSGALFRRYDPTDFRDGPIVLANRSPGRLDAVVTVTGIPRTPRPEGGDGFAISRQYYNLAGEAVSVADVAQNERFVVVLEVTEETPAPSRVLIVDRLPAGFEIDNPSLVESADLSAFSWLPEVETAHTEFRDDRFVAALDRQPGDDRTVTLAYVVRAVTPGRYVHPAATVEDMYRPELSARTAQGAVEVVAPER